MSALARVLAMDRIGYVVFGTQEQLIASAGSAAALRSFECLDVTFVADRTTADDVEPGAYFVGVTDPKCLSRLRPVPAPSSSGQ